MDALALARPVKSLWNSPPLPLSFSRFSLISPTLSLFFLSTLFSSCNLYGRAGSVAFNDAIAEVPRDRLVKISFMAA